MKISVILPVYNEEDNLEVLYEKLKGVFEGWKYDYEIIFIDDGSSDRSTDILRCFSDVNKKVKLIKFTRNYGQTAALQAGFTLAAGDLIVTMDADLQNNPEDITSMIERLHETNADIISGWRYKRKDSLARRLVSSTANMIISKICGLKLHDYGCTLKVYKSEFVKDLNLYGEMHRFIPAFIHWHGGKVFEMKVSHNTRYKGKSSYGMGRIHRVILDLITTKFLTTYSTKPIHVFGTMGIVSILLGFAVFFYVAIRKMYLGGVWISPLFFISVFLIGFGLLFIFMGIIAEILVRIYFSQTDNKPYRIDEKKQQ